MSAKISERLVSFYLPHLGNGGVERSSYLLAEALVQRGFSAEIVSTGDSARRGPKLPDGVSIEILRSHRVATSIPWLARYLRRRQPRALVSAQSYANVAAILSGAVSRWDGKLIVTERLAIKAAMDIGGTWKDRITPWLMRRLYPKADAIVANSVGAAESLRELCSLDEDEVKVIYNPTFHSSIEPLAAKPLEDPWFRDGSPDVVVTVSRLERQKDLPTLLRAFHLVTKRREARLVIIGDGSLSEELRTLVVDLGMASSVRLIGHQPNPYPYMKRASLFVLSSLYEGLPNVLIEALAVGTPVVATDAPGGTAEVLGNGEFGVLVEAGNAESLAAGIEDALANPERMNTLAGRARPSLDRFLPSTAATRYEELILR